MKTMSEIPDGRLYSTREVSAMFGVNQSTVNRWADSGQLKCFRTYGGHRRYTEESIVEFRQLIDHTTGRGRNGRGHARPSTTE
ncbi:MAG TPA: helix-turn-helix domain-containing protein [Bacteroidota bacterium]